MKISQEQAEIIEQFIIVNKLSATTARVIGSQAYRMVDAGYQLLIVDNDRRLVAVPPDADRLASFGCPTQITLLDVDDETPDPLFIVDPGGEGLVSLSQFSDGRCRLADDLEAFLERNQITGQRADSLRTHIKDATANGKRFSYALRDIYCEGAVWYKAKAAFHCQDAAAPVIPDKTDKYSYWGDFAPRGLQDNMTQIPVNPDDFLVEFKETVAPEIAKTIVDGLINEGVFKTRDGGMTEARRLLMQYDCKYPDSGLVVPPPEGKTPIQKVVYYLDEIDEIAESVGQKGREKIVNLMNIVSSRIGK